MVRLSAIIISLLLIFSFQAQAKSPPPGTGTTDIPANILIMLDKSGSMRDALASNTVTQYPIDVAADSSGNVYVADHSNRRIMKWAPGATEGVSIITGIHAYGIHVDGSGNIYVSDHNYHRVLKYTLSDGSYTQSLSLIHI